MAKKKDNRRTNRLEHLGLRFETSFVNLQARGRGAPVLAGEPEALTWYRLPVEEGITADGSAYHVYLRRGSGEKLCVFLSGGGLAWDAHSAAQPSDMGKKAAGEPGYYWSNLRPVTEPMNIQFGICDGREHRNPFREWSFLVITYATGDLHIGRSEVTFLSDEGEENLVHYHGYRNFRAGMERGLSYLPTPKKLLIAGDSAGAIAVPALTGEILDDFFPKCRDVTLFSDSGLLHYRKWKSTLRDVWQAEERLWKASHHTNLLLDWYEDLHSRRGDSLRYLYAGSTHDYLLAAYYNDMATGQPESTPEAREKFFAQYRQMVRKLYEMEPTFHFYVYDWKNVFTHGGTLHTCVRRPEFYRRPAGDVSMATWLADAVDGRCYSVGLSHLTANKGRKA